MVRADARSQGWLRRWVLWSARGWFLALAAGLLLGGQVQLSAQEPPQLKVSADFENGSLDLDGIDQESGRIRFRPSGQALRGWPCWWYFRVDGIAPGHTLHLEIDRSLEPLPVGTGAGNEGQPLSAVWSRPLRAFYSIDGGKTWERTEPGVAENGRMTYRQRIDHASALFAWGPPFSLTDAAQFTAELARRHPFVTRFELCRSREGRSVPALEIKQGDRPDDQRYGLWLQARQHAWESGGSWVGRGLIEWLVSDDPRAQALRQSSRVFFVPVMDADSVATGNGGKGQSPQDHNRDWTASPHFPEVRAAQQRIAALNAAGRFDLFIDLHNPGAGDKQPFFFVSPDELLSPLGKQNLARFVQAAQAEITGPLKLADKTRPSGASYSPKWREISKNWVTLNAAPHVVALTLETSWNTPHSTAEGYQTVGRQLGLAIERYFRTPPREGS